MDLRLTKVAPHALFASLYTSSVHTPVHLDPESGVGEMCQRFRTGRSGRGHTKKKMTSCVATLDIRA